MLAPFSIEGASSKTGAVQSHARLLGFDLCPRLKELKQRHLFVPRGTKVPAEIVSGQRTTSLSQMP
jgi:TnpA family transposase